MASSCIQNGYNSNNNMYKMYIQNVNTKCIYKMYIQNDFPMYILMSFIYTKFVLKFTVPVQILIQNEHTRLHLLVYNMYTK